MKITIENTSRIIEFTTPEGACVPARIWQGQTESGIPVQVYVTRIAPEMSPSDPRQVEFVKELAEVVAPRPTVQAIPLRLLL